MECCHKDFVPYPGVNLSVDICDASVDSLAQQLLLTLCIELLHADASSISRRSPSQAPICISSHMPIH